MSTIRWRKYLDSLTINTKYSDSDPIVSHRSTMERISKGNFIYSSVFNNYLVQTQKYC